MSEESSAQDNTQGHGSQAANAGESTTHPIGITDPASSLSTHLKQGIAYLVSTQQQTGCVEGEVVWCSVITAQYVLVAHMTHQEIPAARQSKLLRYFRAWQTSDGGWGMHPESPPYLFVTTFVYVALRLLGVPPSDEACQRAQAWLKSQPGVENIPSWGKLWLALMNLYGYEGVQPVLPELWLLPAFFPLHPSQLYCHTRLIYLGFCYLYGVRFQIPVTPLLEELRGELYNRPYISIDFASYRHGLTPTDVYSWPNQLVRSLFWASAIYERFRVPALRQRALRQVLEHIIFHQRASNFAALSPINGLLNTLALYHANHPDFGPSFGGLDYWTWEDEADGERFSGARSQTWDTAFAVQAICEGPAAGRFTEFLHGTARFLKQAQISQELPSHQRFYQDQQCGGFCFGDAHHRWPVSDCTGEALSAISYLHDGVAPEERIEPLTIINAVRFVLLRQNQDGGWSSYERRRGGMFLEFLNTSEMFANCMVEHRLR